MPRLFSYVLAVFGVLTSFAQAQEFASPIKTLELNDGDSIVFLGDSITHQCLYTQYVEDYLYTRFPQKRLKIHNSGVGGAQAWDALQRFDKDVAAYKPKYVTVLLGMNDGHYHAFDTETFENYRRDMTTVIDKIVETGAQPILMTPTMFDARAARLRDPNRRDDNTNLYNSVMAYYGTWLREQAVERGVGFVDMWSPLNNVTLEQRKTKPEFTLIEDSVHPGPAGHVIMALAILDDMELPRDVSAIRIARQDDANIEQDVDGGELSEVEFTDNGITFTFASEALPFVVPEEARLGGRLTHLGHRISRESLTVQGLAPGKYRLTIDGNDCGTFSSMSLGRQVELQSIVETPQFQQALAVAELNKKRNEGPVRSLRNEWSRFQNYARQKQRLEGEPDNDEVKNRIAQLEKELEGMDERVKRLNDEAREIEDQIFETNQPQPHQYVLKRVKN